MDDLEQPVMVPTSLVLAAHLPMNRVAGRWNLTEIQNLGILKIECKNHRFSKLGFEKTLEKGTNYHMKILKVPKQN